MPRAKARPERPRVRSGSACGVFRLSVRRVCPAGTTARPCLFGNGPAADLAGSSGWVRRLGSSLGRLSVRRGGRRGAAARSCLFWGGPAGTQQETAGGLAGPCWKRVWLSVPCVALGSVFGARSRVWRSVPCLALGPVFGACRERPALRGAFVPVPASGCPGGAIAPPRSSRR